MKKGGPDETTKTEVLCHRGMWHNKEHSSQAARSLINQESKFRTLASWNTRNFIKQVKFIDKDNDFQTLS